MQEFMSIYEQHQDEVEKFILTTLKNHGSLHSQSLNNYRNIFQKFPSVELVYVTNLDFEQTTENFYRNKQDSSVKGMNRDYMNTRVLEKEESFSVSTPYISSATGHTCITVMKKEGEQYIFIDFQLSTLLGRLGLVELNPAFNDFTKLFYKAVGFSLMGFAIVAVFYALFSYGSSIIVDRVFTLDTLFKPIVAITLGLAIFDLAKTILEREVFFKNFSKEDEDGNVLTKFSIAIIIALSIEALMVVFKIALHDYSEMVYALYLFIGNALIIFSFGIYGFLTKKT